MVDLIISVQNFLADNNLSIDNVMLLIIISLVLTIFLFLISDKKDSNNG